MPPSSGIPCYWMPRGANRQHFPVCTTDARQWFVPRASHERKRVLEYSAASQMRRVRTRGFPEDAAVALARHRLATIDRAFLKVQHKSQPQRAPKLASRNIDGAWKPTIRRRREDW